MEYNFVLIIISVSWSQTILVTAASFLFVQLTFFTVAEANSLLYQYQNHCVDCIISLIEFCCITLLYQSTTKHPHISYGRQGVVIS